MYANTLPARPRLERLGGGKVKKGARSQKPEGTTFAEILLAPGFLLLIKESEDIVAQPKVAIVLGSDSDYPVIEDMIKILKDFGIEHELTISSAHRSPQRTQKYAAELEQRGVQVVIACAGAAAHLAGVIASHTILPVIGVPIDSSPLNGLDALLSTSMMPAGVPVATMGIGKSGASNAAVLAAQILARSNPELSERLRKYKGKLAARVEERDRELRKARDV
jgi:phosphoribosylaminoimidazole carboxylase PurE protein